MSKKLAHQRGEHVVATQNDLVFDIGAHTGEDTAFYLGKGFRVVAVEANPTLAQQLCERFSIEIENGRLVVVQRAILRRSGNPVSFFINIAHDDWSSVHRDVAMKGNMDIVEVTVETTSLADLCSTFGVPYYLKVDIGMNAAVVVQSLVDLPVLPAYCSFEFHEDGMLNLLHEAGYQEFQIVNQLLNGLTERVTPAREGADFWPGGFTGYHSGYFGRDLPGDDWVDFAGTREWRAANNIATRHGFMKHSWFDLHARRSDDSRRSHKQPADPPTSLPNFFLSGAAKSGTTSMWRYLQAHPDIFMTDDGIWKEPSYYCHFREGFGVADRAQYEGLFDDVTTEARIGEASGPYLTSPESPALIHAEIPHAQFIVMLRNPVDRAWSLYKWMHHHGYESIQTFREALRAEREERLDNVWFKHNNGQYYHNFLYVNSGFYAPQVKRLFDTFGSEQVKVIIFEDFVRDTARVVAETYRFLGVDDAFIPPLSVHNASPAEYGSLDPAVRHELTQTYADSVKQLGVLLERDLATIWT